MGEDAGTGKRRPKPRDPSDVITQERPEPRIVGAETWILASGHVRQRHRPVGCLLAADHRLGSFSPRSPLT